ncbi:MAG TPA: rhodanese-like domain-containing protein [Patescibacteria group bacterium]|nr:rhodanese-like domain-containing protein [Patescibacteria group bacterium]
MRRRIPRILAVAMALTLVACGTPAGDASGVRTVAAAEAVELLGGRTIIDVRTPAETAAGMLDGAVNIDIGAADFRERIASLDRGGSYLLYCRTGNRSAQAASIMRDLGFTDVIDAGGFDSLVGAGAPTAP